MIKIINSYEFNSTRKTEDGLIVHQENPHHVFKKYRDFVGVRVHKDTPQKHLKIFHRSKSDRMKTIGKGDNQWFETGEDILTHLGFKGRKKIYIAQTKIDLLAIPRGSLFIGPKYDGETVYGIVLSDGKVIMTMLHRLYCYENMQKASDILLKKAWDQGACAWLEYFGGSDDDPFVWACDQNFDPIHLKRNRFLRSIKKPEYDYYGRLING